VIGASVVHRWGGWILLAVGLLGAVVFYSPTLGAGFTTWDDPDAVLRNTAIRDVTEGPASDRLLAGLALFHPARLRLGDYAPVAQLSLAFDLSIGDADPSPFHATQIALFGIALALVLLVGHRLGAGTVGLCLGAALFVLHPVQAEPVSWISCRGRLLASVFGLLAVASQLGPRPRPGRAAVWLALGLLSKVSALAYLPAVLVAGGVIRRQTPVLAVPAGALLVLLISRLGPAAPEEIELGRLVLLPDGLARYLHVLAVPGASSVYHGVDALGDGFGWGTILGALAVAGLLAAAPPPSRRVAGALLLASLVLYLPNVVVRSGVSPVADRYLFDPLAALAWLLATARIPVRWAPWPAVRVGAALAVVLVLGCMGPAHRARQALWSDAALLWADAASKYPASPFVWMQLGVARETAGDSPGAEVAYRRHLERRPESAPGYNNLARAIARQGRAAEALPLLDRALALDPSLGPIWFNRGEVLLYLGRTDEAYSTFQKAVSHDPKLGEAFNAMGVILLDRGDRADARVAFERAIEARPERPNAHYNLGILLAHEGHLQEAEGYYREAIRLQPGHRRAHNNLGLVYLRMGRYRDAIRTLEGVLVLDPGFEPARVNLGRAYMRLALAEWEDIVRNNPERTRLLQQLEQLQECGIQRTLEATNETESTGDPDDGP
jgi:tetratricopeptide (TPR) repeat protein